VAEAIGGADPERAAAIYLGMADQVVQVSPLDFRQGEGQQQKLWADRMLDEALRWKPNHPYGLFLKGVRESRLGNLPANGVLELHGPHAAPPAQQAVWAPSGEWLATTCTRFTGGPNFACPEMGRALFMPGSSTLAYTYTFGDGVHLFAANNLGRDRPIYLGPVEVSVLGGLRGEVDEVPLE